MAQTDYDWQSSRNDIVQRAFRIVGALPLGESLSAEQLAQGITALNDMVKSWQTENIFLWTRRLLTISLTPGDADYPVPLDPPLIGIDSAWIVNGTSQDPVQVLSYRQYLDLTDKTDEGTPSAVAFDERSTIYVWPVPTSSQTLNLHAVIRTSDFDVPTSTAEFTAKWSEALIFGLAHRLSFEHTLELGEIDRIEKMAFTAFAKAKKADHGRGQYEYVRSAF